MKSTCKTVLIGLFLFLGTLSLQAQSPVFLGNKAGVTAKFKAPGLNARAPLVQQPLPDNKALALKVNISREEDEGNIFVGEVVGLQQATFFLKISAHELVGYIILKEERTAYEYYADEKGGVYVRELDIDKVICTEYLNTNQATTSSAGENAPTAVPVLESLPGATAVVLLDFDGQVVSSSRWNGGTTINAAPANLTTAEVIEVWKLMAEDFSPFNINITTSEEVFFNAPANRRIRCIFTPTRSWYGNWGGTAYINSFTYSDDTPCWVFNSGVKGAGEAGSHEIGHALGLRHDGTNNPVREYYPGHGNWGPIMGACYRVDVVQWSKGEYPNASRTEDDLSIITSAANGFGYRTDDHGNDNDTPTPLDVAVSGTVSVAANQGLIGQGNDVDVYSFITNAGDIKLHVNPTSTYPNLDILLRLKDADGTTVAIADPDDMGASIQLSVPAGTYYLHVESAKGTKGATSNYGSLGAYSISGNIPYARDVSAPVLAGVPKNTTAGCDKLPDVAVVTAKDKLDGNVSVSFSESINETCQGNYTLTRSWSAADVAGNKATAIQLIHVVDNEPPVLTGVPPKISALVSEGRCSTPVVYPEITATDNCSNSTITFSPASGSSFPLGLSTVLVSAVDECGNETEGSFIVEVTNEDPVVTDFSAGLEPQLVGQQLTISASIVDNNLASATWHWGDGSMSSAEKADANSVSGSHAYAEAGFYTVKLVVEDLCGASAWKEYPSVLVYDPSAGFVTGNGWFYSPPGAFRPNTAAEGTANFGFSSKYSEGAAKPQGVFDFTLFAANLSFKSDAYQWLIVSAHKASFAGTGSVNGVGGYNFLLSAEDGLKLSSTDPDRIHLKLWDNEGNIVYDNQLAGKQGVDLMMTLKDESILIHPGKAGMTHAALFKAYPNPLNKLGLWLEFPSVEQAKEVQAHIYDARGKLLTGKSFRLESYESKQLWQLEHKQWHSGVYLLVIRGDGFNRQFKLIKQ